MYISNPASTKSIPGAQGVAVRPDVRERLASHLRDRGERVVCAAVRISRASLGRVLAGLPVRLGTAALVEAGLAVLDADAERARAVEGGGR